MVAVGLVVRGDGAVLVTPGQDAQTGEGWHRLVGGAVEHGELGARTVAREFVEEYGLQVAVGERVAVVENLFTVDGVQGHELVLVYETRLLDAQLEARSRIPSLEPRHPACLWVNPDEARLVPAAVASLVTRR